MNSMYNSDDEDGNIQSSIEQNHQRWSSMRYSDSKHINPRTGEILAAEKSSDINNISYDSKNGQPLTTNNDKFINRKSAKENESPSQSSMKDSAYGSIDLKTTSPLAAENRQLSINEIHEQKAFPSQQLQQVLQKTQIKTSNLPIGYSHTKSPLPNSKLNFFSKTMSPVSSQFASRELITQNKARSMNQSASSLTNFPKRLADQKDHRQSPLFSSMKDTPYDSNGSLLANRNNSEQYNGQDNTLNVVQGQMKINPYATSSTVNHNMNGKVMNPHMLQLEPIANDDETPNHIELTESEMDSLMQIKKMLIETKTGLPE